jgi:hypothetical protein
VEYVHVYEGERDQAGLLKMEIAYYRSGETGDDKEFNQVVCYPHQPK